MAAEAPCSQVVDMNRVKDKARRLARHHKVYLTDVNKLHDNVERARLEAKSALEAKKRLMQQAIERRFEEAMEAVDDEIQAKKLPLDQAASDIKRSSAVLDAALETLEDKLKEPQHDFIQRFVPMIEVCSLMLSCISRNYQQCWTVHNGIWVQPTLINDAWDRALDTLSSLVSRWAAQIR